MKSTILLSLGFICFLLVSCEKKMPYQNASLPVEQRVEDLLKRLTLEEKVQLIGGDSTGFATKGIKRLDIPPLKMSDGPIGVHIPKGTAFPCGAALASSWDTTLLNSVGVNLAAETKAGGINIILGPCINIHRFPYGGRNFESYSEDPYLVSRLAVSYIKGIQSQNIIPTLKHFACNNQEWQRNNVDVIIDERALREIYLPGFRAGVVEGGTWGVMSAYNIVNGSHCSENKHLLNDILKNEWGFKGFVVSDWVSVYSTVNAANNGLDLEMPQSLYFSLDSIKKYIATGAISEKVIDEKVRRLLRVRFLAGLFDKKQTGDTTVLQSTDYKAFALKAAQEGIVLLKNDGILPLNKKQIKKIAVIGPVADPAITGGGGSSHQNPFYAVSPLEGIKAFAGKDVEVTYAKGDIFKQKEVYPIAAALLFPPVGKNGKGLYAEYYSNKEFKGIPVFTRFDSLVNFSWGTAAPDPRLPKDNFSVVWTGRLIPVVTGIYELQLKTDDGSRLYIDGKLIVDHWGNHGAELKAEPIKLIAGKSYDLKMEYYDAGGGADAILGLKSPDKFVNKTNLISEAVKVAKSADVAVVFVGDNEDTETEGSDHATGFKLPENQDELLQAVVKANPNTIVVLGTAIPVYTTSWLGGTKALIQSFYLGQETGNAIAGVIFGDVNPSGKLTFSFISGENQTPALDHYLNPDLKAPYAEGIYVGYRFLEHKDLKPVFPFGFGLSYTTYSYGAAKVSENGNKSFSVSLTVTNSGKTAGSEIIQLYVSPGKPQVDRPLKELKAFARVDLKAGETKTVTMKLNAESFSYYSIRDKNWVADPGQYKILIGSSSQDIRQTADIVLK